MSQLTIWGTARRRRRRAGSGSSVDNRCNTKMAVLADLGSQTFGSGACARMCTENTQTGHLNGQGHGRHSSFAALEHGRGRDTRFDSPRLKSNEITQYGHLAFFKKTNRRENLPSPVPWGLSARASAKTMRATMARPGAAAPSGTCLVFRGVTTGMIQSLPVDDRTSSLRARLETRVPSPQPALQ